MDKKFYITTPIYYVNDIPHIGHTCTTVAADIIARYHKLQREKVFFLTGTDEHGAKVAEAAKKEGLEPKEFCDKVSKTFSDIWPRLNIEYDYFIRTTDPQHEKIVSEILTKIYEKGDIYKAKYSGLYCIGCEKFVTETDLVDGKCPLHPNREVIKQSEENYFFKLSKYVPTLIEAIEKENHPYHYKISPESKKSEVLAKLKAGINDLSISRAEVSWGIPIPWDKAQTIYVWVEALFNYYTATKIAKKENFWPTDLHLVGKEILWFHAAIWEALLIAADLPLPKEVFAHSFYTIDGQKMSKSLGNVISPQQLLDKFGIDGARYLIASSFPLESDSDVGWEKFTKKYNADLANGLGNLVARVAKLTQNFNLKFEQGFRKTSLTEEVFIQIERFNLSGALEIIQGAISGIDKYINRERPWESKTKAIKVLREIIVKGETVNTIREIAYLLSPFMPETSGQIEEQFSENKIISKEPLFPRIK